MRILKHVTAALGILLIVPQAWAAVPPMEYSAKPIRGLVVDAETGQPLEGVIVAAQWVLFIARPADGTYGPRLHVLETVTDTTGAYQFPGWGPKPNPRYPFSSLDTRDPEMSFFKPGYKPEGVDNRYESNDVVRASDWDGKTIKLEKFKGTAGEWADALSFLQTSLSWGHLMDWRQVSRTTLAILEERSKIPYRLSDRVSGAESLTTTLEQVRRFVEGQK